MSYYGGGGPPQQPQHFPPGGSGQDTQNISMYGSYGGVPMAPSQYQGGGAPHDPRLRGSSIMGSYEEYNQHLMNPPAPAPSPYVPEYYGSNQNSYTQQQGQDTSMGDNLPRPHVNPNFLSPEKPAPTKILRNPYPETSQKKGRKKDDAYDPSCPTLTGSAINVPGQTNNYSGLTYQQQLQQQQPLQQQQKQPLQQQQQQQQQYQQQQPLQQQHQYQQHYNPSAGVPMVPAPNPNYSNEQPMHQHHQQQPSAYPPQTIPSDPRQMPPSSYNNMPTNMYQHQPTVPSYQDNSNTNNNNSFNQMRNQTPNETSTLGNQDTNETGSTVKTMTGLVTQIQPGGFGMISEEIFFQQSCVTGSMPRVGDKVVVEAEPVNGMPFKYNAKRVTKLDMDLVNEEKSMTAVVRNTGMDLAPLPSLPDSLNLPKPELSSVPLKSILKRNPPPPPVISKTGSSAKASKNGPSASSFKSSATASASTFSVDLERDIPRVLPPSGGPPIEFPEYTYVRDNIPQSHMSARSRSPQVTRLIPEEPPYYNGRRAPSPDRRVAPPLSPTMQEMLDMNEMYQNRDRDVEHRDRVPHTRDHLRSPSSNVKVSRKYSRSRSPSPRSKRSSRKYSRSRSPSPRKSSRRKSRSRSPSPRRVSRRKSRSKSPVPKRSKRSRSRSHSPKSRNSRRSRSRSVTPKRRSRSRTPERRRGSKSPTRRSHHRSSRSRSRERKRSRSPAGGKYRRESRSRSRDKKKARSPADGKYRRESYSRDKKSRSRSPRRHHSRERQSEKSGLKGNGSPSWRRKSSSSSVQSVSPGRSTGGKVHGEEVTHGIVFKKVVSDLFRKQYNRDDEPPTANVKAKQPPKSTPVPIKFQIANPSKQPPAAATMVPNPSYRTAPPAAPASSSYFNSSVLNITKTVVNPSAANTSQHQSMADAKSKSKKKEQEPAFKIIEPEITRVFRNPGPEQTQQEKAVTEAKIHQWELERQHLRGKVGENGGATSGTASSNLRNPVNILQLKQTIENDLQQLRQKGNSDVGKKLLENPVSIEQLKQSVQRDLSQLKDKNAPSASGKQVPVNVEKIQNSVNKGLTQLKSKFNSNPNNKEPSSLSSEAHKSKTTDFSGKQIPSTSSSKPGTSGSGRNEKSQRKNFPKSTSGQSDSDELELPPYDERLERLQEEIHQQRFLEEQHRLRATGDEVGLQQLFYMEDRRRRRLDERNLARLRALEIQLKKEKNFSELARLRNEWGPTHERFEQERMLREARKEEEHQQGRLGGQAQAIREHETEYQQWLEEEATARLRGMQQSERDSRGCEGRVLRRRTPSPERSRPHGHRGDRSGSNDRRNAGEDWDPSWFPPPHPAGFGPPPGHPDFFDGPPHPGFVDDDFHRARMEEEMMHHEMEMRHRMEMGGGYPPGPPHHGRGPPPPHRGDYTRFPVPRR